LRLRSFRFDQGLSVMGGLFERAWTLNGRIGKINRKPPNAGEIPFDRVTTKPERNLLMSANLSLDEGHSKPHCEMASCAACGNHVMSLAVFQAQAIAGPRRMPLPRMKATMRRALFGRGGIIRP